MTTTWVDYPKATGTTWTDYSKGGISTISAGEPIGLLLALTYAESSTIITTIWTDFSKAAGTIWTDITKAL